MALRNPFDTGIEPEFTPTEETSREEKTVPEEIVRTPKRGRPSKTAPVYDTDGSLLLSSEQREKINSLVDDINSCRIKVEKILLTAAQKHFQLGEILYQVEKKSVGKMTAARYEEITGVPHRLVHTALKIYKNFADNPEALENMTMREVAMMIEEKKELPGNEVSHVKYSLPEDNSNAELISETFGLGTLSGVELENYRIHADSSRGTIYLLDRQTCGAIPVASLSVSQPQDPVAENAYKTLMSETQMAFEKYYAILEKEEEA